MIKKMKKSTKMLCELLCIVLTLSLLLGAVSVFANEQTDAAATDATADTVQAVRLVMDAPRGTRLNEKYVEVVELKNLNLPSNLISDVTMVMAKYMAEDGFEGQYITSSMLSDRAVAAANDDLLVKKIDESKADYVVVTDYVVPNTGENLSVFLQELIDSNPNRCIYFPAGEYVISEPLTTSSVPKNSVSLLLDDGAVIKASDDWKGNDDNALICLGGTAMANDITSVGSYYTLIGGTLDANGKANGIAISSGRESVIRNICIKNAKIGITIPRGTNSSSSDVDFEDITIIGQGKAGTVGIYDGASDNSFTNIRIYDMATGMDCRNGGEIKSIYVINTEKSAAIANSTVGFEKGNPRMTQCYTENCAIGFNMGSGAVVINDCTSVWTLDAWKKQVMFSKSKATLQISGCRAQFLTGEGVTTAIVEDTTKDGGGLYMEGCIFDPDDVTVAFTNESDETTPAIDPKP